MGTLGAAHQFDQPHANSAEDGCSVARNASSLEDVWRIVDNALNANCGRRARDMHDMKLANSGA